MSSPSYSESWMPLGSFSTLFPSTCSLAHLTYWPSLSTENMWLKFFSFLIFYITGTAMSTLPYSYLLFLAFMIPVTAWLVNQNRKLFKSPYGSIYLKYLNSKTLYSCPPDCFWSSILINTLIESFKMYSQKANKWWAGPTSSYESVLSLKEHRHVTRLEHENVTENKTEKVQSLRKFGTTEYLFKFSASAFLGWGEFNKSLIIYQSL